METDLVHVLESVGYQGPLLQVDKLSHALELGPKSTEYTGLVAWFAEQIGTFINIDETIHPTHTSDDASSFLLELSCFLKEIGCVNQNLTTGNVNQRLASKGNRTLLLEILISELMACKLLQAKDPEVNTALEVIINESDTARHLKNMLIALQFQKPPENITPQMLFTRLENKLKEVISKVPNDLLGKPLFFGELSTDQWNKLCDYDKELQTEYEIRREMLLKRLDVTVRSFLWSERVQAQEKELNSRYHSGRSKMGTKPNVGIADLLAARDDLAVVEKTSNATVRKNTRSSINKVIIGNVPDRGGRPYEQEPPPPEMPPWQKDRVAGPPSSGGRGRGGNTGGSGGRGGARGGSYGSSGSYGTGGNSGGGYVNIGSTVGYGSAGDGYGGNHNYSGGGGGGNYGQDYQRSSGRGGRVQGGWNQGGHNSTRNNYQRDGYSRGRGWGERQY
ncbi:hypothetical protein KPH14_009920 [Odynerus spinipes]|uniref:Protein FAM98A n=1 Tax=Odynerus spinipes TaxID=1348599 RepID=A0AAD9VT80_9HYME|nr:hypothetical protein KPH14_009920 [Odynerus spinipes]